MKVVFYDGVCALCNTFIKFALFVDRKRCMKYAPLQGKKAKELLSKEYTEDLKTIVYYRDGKELAYTDAVLKMLSDANSLFKVLYIIPRFLRDFIYKTFAKRRYQIGGQLDSCPIPSESQRDLFLD